MMHLAEQILALTRDLATAAETGDVALCSRLLEDRGRLAEQLSGARRGADPAEVADVAALLDQVGEMDAELMRHWRSDRDRLGDALTRIQRPGKKTHDTEAPCVVNRRA